MEPIKHSVDAGAALVGIASFLHWMPDIAAFLTAVWYVIRIAEWALKKLRKNGTQEKGSAS